MSKNTNCLEGLACPECGQADRLHISVTGMVEMTDDGFDGFLGDTEWDDTSYAVCPECEFRGTVREFRV